LALVAVLTAVGCGPSEAARSTVAPAVSSPPATIAPTAPPRETVTFKSGSLDLQGFIWKPAGPGPFPVVVWNHGGDNAASEPYYEKLWPLHVRAGFLFFIPQRRGQGGSPGVSVNVQFNQAPAADRNRMQVELFSTVALADQLAALAYLKTRPDVDTSRIAVSGWSAGGQLTLIGAEADPGYRVAVACSSASISWDGSPELQQRLVATVSKIKIPVLMFQAENDYSLNPQKVLGAEFKRLGKRYEEMVYPPHGTTLQDGHTFCVDSPEIWGDRVITFLRNNLP
jgi:dienelactone hydrolase